MPKEDADTKSARQNRLTGLFARHRGRFWSARELAAELGCTTRTVQRDLAELGTNGRLPLIQEGEGPTTRYCLMEDGRVDLGTLHLDVREGTVLYLAARLLAQQTDEYNLHVMNALDKLVAAMPAHVGAPLHDLLRATAVRQARGTDLTGRFSDLVLGWAQRKVVAVRYRAANTPSAFTCRFRPYLFEPSSIGRTIYVIGHATPPGALRTYKLERIENTTLTEEPFTVPDDFDASALLNRSWSVMYGEGDPVLIRLRFSRHVAERVKETIWHPGQKITDLADGSCEWEALIGDMTEIKPWVRGWGSDCEVLQPEALRVDVIKHVRRLARSYGLTNPSASGVGAEGARERDAALDRRFDEVEGKA